jgi:hypothetical protein
MPDVIFLPQTPSPPQKTPSSSSQDSFTPRMTSYRVAMHVLHDRLPGRIFSPDIDSPFIKYPLLPAFDTLRHHLSPSPSV